jgi:ATP-dependent Clp protease adapter protein ClpS
MASPLMEPKLNLTFTYEPFYRVVLIYSNWTYDKEVAQKVHNAVPVIGFNDALRVVRNAEKDGRAIVITCIKDDANQYVSNLKKKGLDVTIVEA